MKISGETVKNAVFLDLEVQLFVAAVVDLTPIRMLMGNKDAALNVAFQAVQLPFMITELREPFPHSIAIPC